MTNYQLNIKSHTEAPDYEDECEAETRGEAIKIFRERLRGEFDYEFISNNTEELSLTN